MENKELKTYIFQNVLCDYTSGIAVARATSKEHAISLLLEEVQKVLKIKKTLTSYEDVIRYQDEKKQQPTSNCGTTRHYQLEDFEIELRTTPYFFEIENTKTFAVFQGGGS